MRRKNKELCENIGAQGHALILESKGATVRALTLIEKAIKIESKAMDAFKQEMNFSVLLPNE